MKFLDKFYRLAKLPDVRRRRAVVRLFAMAFKDDTGGEVMEYALVGGLIVAGAISAIACVGTKVLARWNSLSSSL